MSKQERPALDLSLEQLKELDFIPVTQEDATEKFLSAEQLIQDYEAAVRSGGGSIPSREDIGRACLCLLFQSESLVSDKYFRLVTRLLTPAVGMSMYACLSDVLALHKHATARLEILAKEQAASSQLSEANPNIDEDIF